MKKKFILYFINSIMFTSLFAQTKVNDDATFYKNRIALAPESAFKKFIDAGMNPTNHVLTDMEQEKIAKAFSLLPPLHVKILKENLHSISFMDNMPNTALTSPVTSADSIKKFNITFRAGILNETISEWATWKERSLYDVSANPTFDVTIDAGNLDAFVYVLLHEATHIVDVVLKLTPNTEEDENLVQHTSYTKNIWRLFNSPKAKFTNSILEKTRFRSGKVQPIISAKEIYDELEKTPFVSLYGMASWYEDIAELVTIYHLTNKINQPFVIYVKENGVVKSKFVPMKNKLVNRRLKQLEIFYS
jgi:hypothetical protein